MELLNIPPVLTPDTTSTNPVKRTGWLLRVMESVASGLDWLFGFVSILLGLAIISIVPVVNFLSLGYLIHASGRVAATGRLRDGFVGIRKASMLGSFALGTWFVFLPARVVSGLWKDAELVAPGSPTAGRWQLAVLILTVLTVVHVVGAGVRGGRLWHFLWPAPLKLIRWLRHPSGLESIRHAAVDFVVGLRLPHYFWLGARAFAGALAWLLIPVGTLLFAAQFPPDKGGGILSLVGGFLLMVVALHLPFLQTHFALENRFRALFALGAVRELFQRAPVAFWLALFITLLFALPLYLLKIELPPREIAWLPALMFVVFMFPARLLVGWAVGRARRREAVSHWCLRWASRLALVPVVFAYALWVYLMQYLSWNGTLSLLEQHAFLVPAPLMNL